MADTITGSTTNIGQAVGISSAAMKPGQIIQPVNPSYQQMLNQIANMPNLMGGMTMVKETPPLVRQLIEVDLTEGKLQMMIPTGKETGFYKDRIQFSLIFSDKKPFNFSMTEKSFDALAAQLTLKNLAGEERK